MNSKGLYQQSGKEKDGRCLSPFHVVVVQRGQRNIQKSVMHVQSRCFAFFAFLVAFAVLVFLSSLLLLCRLVTRKAGKAFIVHHASLLLFFVAYGRKVRTLLSLFQAPR